MPISRRRRLAVVIVTIAALVVGVAALVVAAGGDNERIGSYWISGELTDQGLEVVEVIDYDFGPQLRRGIYRNVPDVLPGTVRVSSPTAPDDVTITDAFVEQQIRIGDPLITISGRHRYRVEYTLARDAVVQNGRFSWDAVGLEWTVPIEDVQVFVALPAATDTGCRAGTPWSSSDCTLSVAASGALSTALDDLAAGEGATISASIGAGRAPGVPTAPTGAAEDPGSGVLAPAIIAAIAALVGAAFTTVLVRRAGRERVWTGGAADAAFGEIEEGLSTRRMDEKRLAELATIEFEPPRDMSAVEGALLLQERVRDEHLSAWLLEAAIRGEIDIGDEDDPVISRGPAPAHPTVHQILDRMFDGRSSIELESYDADFSKGWSQLEGELTDWLHGAAHWDEAGRRRQTLVRLTSVLALVVGLGVAGLAVLSAARTGLGPAPFIAAGAAVAGAAIGAMVSSYELLVRTETGSALWLRIESFRRFLENSEARHVEEAAEKGVLRQYTAWAVALGETRAWTRAVEAAAAADPRLRSSFGRDLTFLYVASSITSATKTASTAPSSSGSGGGFSGGVGGGGGGGGGGSW
ncbi:MAG: DUF2207 domain-containing protein [Actinomycetota bacterium]